MNVKTFAYQGKRFTIDKKWSYSYWDVTTESTRLLFNNKLTEFDVIGDLIECEETEKGVKGPYKKVGKAQEDKISQWSIEQQTSVLYADKIKRAKLIPSGHVKLLVEEIKKHTDSPADRRRLALWIFDQLT